MRVMLVYSNRARILEPAPPIGLSYVATATRNAGHDVRFVDLMFSPDPHRELEQALGEFEPEVVGISVRNIDNVICQRTSWHLGEVADLIATVRRHSTARVVLGGPAVSILGGQCLERLDADFAIVGEGELAFPELLSSLEGLRPLAEVRGLCSRESLRVVSAPAVRRKQFGASGMQQWIDWPRYERAGGTWAIHTKRGCPLACLYCNYPVMEGHRLRQRAPGDVVDEIERVMAEVGPRTFEFTDSTFNIPESHARGICEEIIRRNLRVSLSAVGINPLTSSEGLFALMKRAGFRSLVISPDSASEAMLRNLRKGFTVEDVRRTVRAARKTGLRCAWFFLLGGPGETRETIEETVSFIEENLPSKKFLAVLLTGIRILPGTALARRATESRYIAPDQDLSQSAFYCAPELDEQWTLDRITRAIARCPNIVHGAEENGSPLERAFNRALAWLGVPPPYFRFLPLFLSLPPLPALRARHCRVRAACRRPKAPQVVTVAETLARA